MGGRTEHKEERRGHTHTQKKKGAGGLSKKRERKERGVRKRETKRGWEHHQKPSPSNTGSYAQYIGAHNVLWIVLV